MAERPVIYDVNVPPLTLQGNDRIDYLAKDIRRVLVLLSNRIVELEGKVAKLEKEKGK